ncbi:MAG: hypothetical protein VYE27_07180 [Pseudomonadota bacterium]|nr:hypothetical protein [Pseudomonadota bacterium]
MNIGVIALGRSTFDIAYAEEKLNQCLEFLSKTKHEIFGSCQILLSESEALKEFEKLNAQTIEFLLIVQVTFTDALVVVEIAKKSSLPLGIWAFPEPRLSGRLKLNAFCGLNLASHSLCLNNRKFSWIYEDPELIHALQFNKLFAKEPENVNQSEPQIPQLTSVTAKSIKEKILTKKVCKIGAAPDGFYTCDYNQKKLTKLCGVEVDELELDDLFIKAKDISPDQVKEIFNFLGGKISELKNVNQEELKKSLRLKGSLQKLQEVGKYDAFAIRCWPEMFTKFGGAICGPVSMMGDNKVPCACEADVYGAVSQLILQEVSKQAVFLTDIVDIDISDNTGVFWHCGQAPLSMCDPNFIPRATIHTNRKAPLLFEFPLKAGEITIMRLSQSFNEHKMVISSGNILKKDLPFTGTSGVVRFRNGSKSVLEAIISSGLEHHVALTYGNHVKILSELASQLNLPVLYL